jgi:hypothetical protein
VRVGERFSIVLTCAVLHNDSTMVIVDETKLEASAVQLSPFDVLSATHVSGVDARDRRFLQYDYDVRVISDSLFATDVALPEIRIPYRVRMRLDSGDLSEGSERTYAVTPASIRVLSIVPDGASDIRDAAAVTFAALESRQFRASMLTSGGSVLMTFGALFVIVGLVQAVSRGRARTRPAPRPLSSRVILRSVKRELDSIGRRRETAGWTPELASRALAALRIAGSYLVARQPSQRDVDPDLEPEPGVLLVTATLSDRTVQISGSVTPRHLTQVLVRPARKKSPDAEAMRRHTVLTESLTVLTKASYARDHEARPDERTLDSALASGQELVRTLLREQFWAVTGARTLARRTGRIRRRLWRR